MSAEPTIIDIAIWGIGGEFSILNIVMALFFLAWNSLCCRIIVVPVVRGIFFGCRAFWQSTNPILLVFPHWYLGIGVPCFMGGLVSASVAVVVPYGFVIYRCVKQALEERERAEANESAALKYDVLDVLKNAQNSVENANHPDGLVTACRTLLHKLLDIKKKDGSYLLDPEKDLNLGYEGLVEQNKVEESNDMAKNSSSTSAFVAFAHTVSGKNTGIPVVQATVVNVPSDQVV